jgi:hypothetical protein
MRLFHFSDDKNIGFFEPRPVRIASGRLAGHEWLNGPLVWAIDELHQPMYLFPRECPRILCWPTAKTTVEDRELWFGERNCHVIAHIEWAWLERLRDGVLYRYELPVDSFLDLHDAGMWVSRDPVQPIRVAALTDLLAELRSHEAELRVMETLAPLKKLWKTSLHVSGIRLRNARGYNESGPTAVPRQSQQSAPAELPVATDARV